MYAVLSVTDKSGIVEFGSGLRELGAELVATSGTARLLRDAGTEAVVIGDLSGVPEMMGGRVRAFHPSVFGGLLYRRGDASDEAEARQHGIPRIEVLACNFKDLVADDGVAGALESIDIGGPAMLRAAAKNFV
ncbi:bifunctional phosphoribosylaminoimidazolecarboxamide formyltransferase/IMP cyclohydrolase, partial [Streptomyces sp. NPDC057654]